MSDIFISYAKEDRARVQKLADALGLQGWSVWWDPHVPAGKRFRDVIDEALTNARCVVVVWSSHSVGSAWVHEEADEGLQRHVLVPVLFDRVDPPRGFRSIQAAQMIEWDGSDRSTLFRTLVGDLEAVLGAARKHDDSALENTPLFEEVLAKHGPEADIRQTAELVRQLLPSDSPTVPGYGLSGSTVGADYYDFALMNGELLLAVGDPPGRGTAAALLAISLRATVREHWGAGSPADTVARVNRAMCRIMPDNAFVTFFYAVLDVPTGRITYVNAGHNPPVLIRATGDVATLDKGGTALGMFESAPFTEGAIEVHGGDTLILYCDGVSDALNPHDEEFGEDGLVSVALRGRALEASALREEILRELKHFAITDDRTLIVLKRY